MPNFLSALSLFPSLLLGFTQSNNSMTQFQKLNRFTRLIMKSNTFDMIDHYIFLKQKCRIWRDSLELANEMISGAFSDPLEISNTILIAVLLGIVQNRFSKLCFKGCWQLWQIMVWVIICNQTYCCFNLQNLYSPLLDQLCYGKSVQVRMSM